MAGETYIPNEVFVTYGTHIVEGFMDGTFVEVEQDQEVFKKHIGSQGEGSRTQNHDESFRIMITLKQNSPSNVYFDSMLELDKQTGSNLLPVSVKYNGGSDIAFSDKGYIVSKPKKEYGDDMTARVWVIDVLKGINNVGIAAT